MAHLAINGGTPIRTAPFHSWPVIDDRDKHALLDVLESGTWGIGSETIEQFEKEFADFCGAKYAVAVTNGTDALSIALQAMGVGANDEVILPPYTFVATGVAIVTVNAVPVFADIDPKTFNLDPQAVERVITPKTKAILPVHIAGNPVDMDGILDLAKIHNLLVLEDAAQAPGAQWKGRHVGNLGNAGTFSFQSSKNLTSGEGGAIVTNDDDLYQRIRSFANCGRMEGGAWYDHYEIAGNHRLSAFQAGLLRVGMQRFEEQLKRREENMGYLKELLDGIEGISLQESYPGTTRHAWHLGLLSYNAEAFQGLPKMRFRESAATRGRRLFVWLPAPL